jgi:hypothetical protein
MTENRTRTKRSTGSCACSAGGRGRHLLNGEGEIAPSPRSSSIASAFASTWQRLLAGCLSAQLPLLEGTHVEGGLATGPASFSAVFAFATNTLEPAAVLWKYGSSILHCGVGVFA